MLKWFKVKCYKCYFLACIIEFGSDNILQLNAQMLSYQLETNFVKSYTTTKQCTIFKRLFQCPVCNCHTLILSVELPLKRPNENETQLVFLHNLKMFKDTKNYSLDNELFFDNGIIEYIQKSNKEMVITS